MTKPQESNERQLCTDPITSHLCKLALEDVLEGDGVSSELADTLTQLLDGHLVLVEVEAEERLVVDVRLLLEAEGGSSGGVKLLGDGGVGVEEVLEQVGLGGIVVTAGKLGDLASVTEAGSHDNGLVAELLVVVVDVLDGLDTGVLLLGVLLLGVGLEPVKDTTDEGGDQEGTGLSGGDGLRLAEHKGQVGVDAVVAL
ncbi:hypothetical protein VM1G_11889 [Cytospora mali]|uniref:Uncharacterized protein n=1 Tax=Cytospora mali TaxID=578113 RepID=A0A194WBQ5_CYTMA|nr:hypothetical protein VM1G_11889 [Valsa mali]